MPIRAAIFDFNGVIVDDERLHFRAFQRILRDAELEIGWDEYETSYLAYDDTLFFRAFFKNHNRSLEDLEAARMVAAKGKVYLQLLANGIPVIEGSLDFIDHLPAGFPIAIASAALRSEILLILGELDILERFSFITAAEDVSESKPDPESFLVTFNKLRGEVRGLRPEEVLVIEDSFKGIAAAREAGMRTVGLTTSYCREMLNEADFIVDELATWSLASIEVELSKTRR